MASRYSVEAIFKAVDRISAPVRTMQRNVTTAVDRMQRSGSRIADSIGRSFRGVQSVSAMVGGALGRTFDGPAASVDRMGERLKAIAPYALAAAAAIAGIGASIIQTGAEFERTLMSAVARFPGEIQRGSEAFEELREAAERVGATTEFDAQQAAGALNVYAAAGFNAQQAIAGLAGAGDLATVSGLTLDEAARTAADSLGALGLRTEDAAQQAANLTRLNDIMARTTGLANTSVSQMAEAIAAGGNVAMQSGASVETFGALVASMAAANIKGAESGTAIRNMYAKLQRPMGAASATLRRLNVDVSDSDGNMRDMVAIIGDLQRATAGMGEVERNASIARIFGLEAMPSVLAAMNAGEQGLAAMRTELENSGGAAERMAGTMRDTAMGDIDGFTSAIDGVKTAIFNMVSGPFRQMLQSMTQWTAANTGWIASGIGDFVQSLADNWGTLVQRMKGIATVIGILGAVALGIKAAAAASALFNAIAMLNPYVALFYAIVAAIGLVVAYWPEISAAFQQMWEGIVEGWSEVADWFSEAWDSMSSTVSGWIDSVTGFFTGMWERVLGIWEWAKANLVNILLSLLFPIYPVFWYFEDEIAALLDWFMSKWQEAKDYLVGLWSGFVSTIQMYWDMVKLGVEIVAISIRETFSSAWGNITNGAAAVYSGILSVFSPLIEFFSGLWSTIAETFQSVFGGIIDRIMAAVALLSGSGGDSSSSESSGDGGSSPQVVSPQERTARTISENNSTTRSELTIRDQTGRAEITRSPRNGPTIRVQPSGAT